METPPSYLYKILSYKSWQESEHKQTIVPAPEDNLFVHLAKEDQLEKIINKYFPNSPQLVVLKLNTDKLQGDLVYETNPEGSTKYYHLYKGFIPFNSVAESRIIYNQSPTSFLEIPQMGEPVLRQVARDLSKEEILSEEIQTLIQDMRETMKATGGCGLAAPQVGKSINLIVIEDSDLSRFPKEKLLELCRSEVPFHVIINPKLYIEDSEMVEFFEGCISIPGFRAIVPRAKAVKVECLNEKGEPIVIHAKGWYSRILQHEIDHLNGIIYLDRAYLSTLTTDENYSNLWKTKSIQEIISSTKHDQTY